MKSSINSSAMGYLIASLARLECSPKTSFTKVSWNVSNLYEIVI